MEKCVIKQREGENDVKPGSRKANRNIIYIYQMITVQRWNEILTFLQFLCNHVRTESNIAIVSTDSKNFTLGPPSFFRWSAIFSSLQRTVEDGTSFSSRPYVSTYIWLISAVTCILAAVKPTQQLNHFLYHIEFLHSSATIHGCIKQQFLVVQFAVYVYILPVINV